MQLNELDEIKQDAIQRTNLIQNQMTKWHDKFLKKVIGLCCLTHGSNTLKMRKKPLNNGNCARSLLDKTKFSGSYLIFQAVI